MAFEPNPVSSEKLRRNLSINGLSDRVSVAEVALSASAGPATLSIPRDVTSASLNTARPDDETISVTVTTGDEVLGGLPVGLVKIDVEGFETDVLLGMKRILRKMRPTIIAECLNQAALTRLRSTASGFGYGFTYQICPDGPVPIDDHHVHKKRDQSRNYLFTRCPLEDLI